MYIVDVLFIKQPKPAFNRHVAEFYIRNFRIRRYYIQEGFVSLLEFLGEIYYHNLSVARIYEDQRIIIDDYPNEY